MKKYFMVMKAMFQKIKVKKMSQKFIKIIKNLIHQKNFFMLKSLKRTFLPKRVKKVKKKN